jgi:hypothetical protein
MAKDYNDFTFYFLFKTKHILIKIEDFV